MNAAHMRAENIDGIDGIRLAIQNQVGGVEADSEIRQCHIANHPRHRRRRLLSRLHQEVLAVPVAMLRDRVDRIDRARIQRVGRVFGNESAMRLNLRDAEQFRKVRSLSQRVNARRTRLWRNQADGRRPLR